MKRWFFIPGFMAMLLLLVSCAGTPKTTALKPRQQAQKIPPPPAFVPEEVALGERVYAENCASCHGVDLEGEAQWKIQNEDDSFRSPPHSAEGHTWHHADSFLIESIEKGGARFEGLNIGGTSAMPAFSGILTDKEIGAVLVYIKSTWPEDIRALQWQQTLKNSSQ
ncbi:MAG: c-type cytochrome [Chloroflexi bacterium]|jgi:mono/diheme cytochrome c family protein|nr:c-type cytochrome [Chloroflexota bacterium]